MVTNIDKSLEIGAVSLLHSNSVSEYLVEDSNDWCLFLIHVFKRNSSFQWRVVFVDVSVDIMDHFLQFASIFVILQIYGVDGNVLCTGSSTDVREGYKSFPSGHTSCKRSILVCYWIL